MILCNTEANQGKIIVLIVLMLPIRDRASVAQQDSSGIEEKTNYLQTPYFVFVNYHPKVLSRISGSDR